MDIWNILGIIAIVLLIYFSFAGRNAVWGALTLGVIIGLITGLVYLIKGDGFNWQLLKKIAIVFTLLGVLFELIGRLKKRHSQ